MSMREAGQHFAKGRGAQIEPPNRFERLRSVPDWADFDGDPEFLVELARVPTQFLPDNSQSIVTQNHSPDVPFRYSVNPYRGCEHGCAYCYARPTHEYLGMNAGLDFESRIIVKERAPELLLDWLSRDAWVPEAITFSGVTDCYQPAERRFELTRRCLEVAWRCRQPVGIITKNALVVRDLDVLSAMAKQSLVHVALSITTLDAELARSLEPRTSRPETRLRAVRELSAAGVPTAVMVAPVIPGLNDSEIPAILEAARETGAGRAGYVMLRLPLAVKPVFLDWMNRTQPSHKERILGALRSVRGGELSSASFGERMRGDGPRAEQIQQTFQLFAKKLGLTGDWPKLRTDLFERPQPAGGQMRLF
jgi:DNA repair photolyase